jgi:hypothetical protein
MNTPAKQQGPTIQPGGNSGAPAAAARDYQDHILRVRGAFLVPQSHSPQDADESLCVVLIGHAMGNVTATGLIRQRADVAAMVRGLERCQVIELAISIMGDPERDKRPVGQTKLAA